MISVILSRRKKKKHCAQALKLSEEAVASNSNYGSVSIGLLNFTIEENIKSFLKLSFVEKDKNSKLCKR